MSLQSEMEVLGEQIAEQAAHLDAATHRMLANIRMFDDGGGWNYQAMSSCAHWLSWRTGMGLAAAREHVRVARRLGELPLVDAALQQGELSYSKVRAITRVATPATEAVLIGYAEHMCGGQLETACRKFRAVQQHATNKPKDEEFLRYVTRRELDNGMVKIEAVLHPDEAALVWKLLDRVAADAARTNSSNDNVDNTSTETLRSDDRSSNNEGTSIETPWSDDRSSDNENAILAPAVRRDVPSASGVAERWATNVSEETSADAEDETYAAALTMKAIASSRTAGAPINVSAEFGDTIGTPDVSAETPSQAERGQDSCRLRPTKFDRADALMAIVQAHARGNRPHRAPIELVVTISEAALRRDPSADPLDQVGVLADGTCLSVDATRRLACDAGVVRLVEDDNGNPLSVGRKRRTFSMTLRRALAHRDPQCQFPGCTNHVFLESHHLEHWADGGETSLENAIHLCSRHHKIVHEHGFRIERGSATEPHRFFDRDMRPIEIVPRVQPRADRGWPAIRAANDYLGITADTSACKWDGRPIDYPTIVEELCGLEDRAAG